MKVWIKSAAIALLTIVLLLTAGMTVCAEEVADPLTSIRFSPCVGYTRVWDVKHPCEGDLVIPAYHNNLPVEQIWTNALSYSNITSVVIPDTVVSLTNGYNFDGCRKMKSVVMSNNVEIIPNHAFSNCDVLETVNLGTGVAKIYYNAFAFTPELKYIEFPTTITEIRSGAFTHSGLQCAYFPGSASQWEQVDAQDYTVNSCVLYETYVKEVVADVNGIKVTADERPGAKQYTFYRQEKRNGTWSDWANLQTTESATYVDETAMSGHTYRYAVSASNGPYTTRISDGSEEFTYVPATTTSTTRITTTTTTTTTATTVTTTSTTRATVTKMTTTTTTMATTSATTTTKPITTATKIRTTTGTWSTTTTTSTTTPPTTAEPTTTTESVVTTTTLLTDDTTITEPVTTATVLITDSPITESTTTTTVFVPTVTSTIPAATQPEQTPTSSWLFLTIGILSGIVIGVIVVVVLKKKN